MNTLCSLRPTASRAFIVVAAALFVSTILLTTSHATSVVKLADDGLVRLSSIIVEGRVTSVHSEWNADHTQIQTLVTIRVSDSIKGAAPGDLLVLRLLGGQVGDTVMELVGGPTFSVDENVIVFLEKDAPELMPITGLFQGKFTVTADPSTGQQMVVGRKMSRDAFVNRISGIVATQEGGR